MTRTDLALQQAETWINEEGTPEQSYVVLMTDGCPTLKESGRGWCRDLVSDDGFVLNMSSKNANDSLRTARRIKNAGSVIDTVYIQLDQGELAAKAYETGKIEDINCEMWGHMPVFLSWYRRTIRKMEPLEQTAHSSTGPIPTKRTHAISLDSMYICLPPLMIYRTI